MRHRWPALIAVLGLGAMMPGIVAAQGNPPAAPPQARSPGFDLGQNNPNPFATATFVPFTLGDAPTCTDAAHEYRVTLRIYNVLAQLVAIPILQMGEFASGQPVVGLLLKCGSYTAYWGGNYLNTTQPVPPGVYLYRMEVDGRAVARKMLVAR